MWNSETKTGTKIMKGKAQEDIKIPAGTKIYIFPNTNKQNSNSPDHSLMIVNEEKKPDIEMDIPF